MGKDQEQIDAGLLAKGPKLFSADGTTNTYQMKPGDQVMQVGSDQSAGVCIVTLPSLAEACGKFYYIIAPAAGSNDVSLYESETEAELTLGDFSDDGDYLLLFCDGRSWVTVVDGVT